MAVECQDELKRAVASADICALLSAAFSFPDENLARALISGTLASDFQECLCELDSLTDETFDTLSVLSVERDSASLVAALRKEYSRLYLMPGKYALIYPYESAFRHVADNREGIPVLFISPVTKDVENRMRRLAVLPENANREPVDSFFREMDFLRLLSTSLANALHQNDANATESWKREIGDFWRQHVETWMPVFLRRTMSETRLDTYRAFADVATAALAAVEPHEGDD